MKTVDRIMKEILALPHAGQREVATRLRRHHLDGLTTTREALRQLPDRRWQQLRDNIIANGGEDITSHNSHRPFVDARMAAIAQMRYEGYSRSEIARAAKKTPSSILNAENNIDEALIHPDAFPLFTTLWRIIHDPR